MASGGNLTATAVGEVEVEDGVLVLKRVHVVLALREVASDKVETARRAHEVFRMKCPIYRSLHRAIDITTELTIG